MSAKRRSAASAASGTAAHKAKRRSWARKVAAGGVLCARCELPIEPGEPWDLDHRDDRSGYLGPSHRLCNRREGGRKGHAQRATQAAGGGVRRWSRHWFGSFDERCPACRDLGQACDDAEAAA